MSGKFDEYTVWTDEDSSLAELDAEHYAKSVRERIDIAVRAKLNGRLPSAIMHFTTYKSSVV